MITYHATYDLILWRSGKPVRVWSHRSRALVTLIAAGVCLFAAIAGREWEVYFAKGFGYDPKP